MKSREDDLRAEVERCRTAGCGCPQSVRPLPAPAGGWGCPHAAAPGGCGVRETVCGCGEVVSRTRCGNDAGASATEASHLCSSPPCAAARRIDAAYQAAQEALVAWEEAR